MATLGGAAYNAGINAALPAKKKKREREVLYAVDRDLEVLVLLVKGQKGEQHKIFQFSTEHCEQKQTHDPFLATNRAGNTYLEFNQDWHLRDSETLFLIQTETNGTCTAKPLSFVPEAEKMPAVQLKNASKDLRKDVWVMEGNADDAGEVTVHSICKSSTDDFLQCEALDCSSFDGSPESTKKLVQRSSKIRSQEVDVNFPCLVYNVGLRQIKVQSTIAPDVCATFNLFDRDFLAFAQYRDFADVGLVDKRSSAEKNAVPFEQTGNKIAFLTRNKHGRDGDIYLNVLQVDPFASPQRFELLETVYEAEMKGGIRDDCIYNAFVMQVTSVRGLDVSFVCQYNDAIIFDCITSTKQLPLRFPMPVSRRTEEETDKYFNEVEKTIEWETALDITKGAVPMKQSMQMDDSGALYFAVKTEAGLMKVLRVDPYAEMGSANFVKSVFSMRCDYIHFLTYANGYFYLMDEKKKVRRLLQDPLTFALRMDTTLEMLAQDQLTVKYSEFDEFIMSDGLMHWDDRIIFLSEQKRKDAYTWGQSKIMAENHKFIQGPKRAKGTGMVYYLEQYDGALQDDQAANPEENEVQNLLERAVTASEFKGFSVMLKPLADLSYIDVLPQFKENHNNFSSYIDQEHILVRHSGRFFVFHHDGRYCGQAPFAHMEPAFRQEQLDIVCISDTMKYFAFEGPNFAARERKEKKGHKKGGKKEEETKKEGESKKEEAKKGGGLLGGLLSAKAEAEAAEEKKKSSAKKLLYVFKLEKVVSGLFAKKASWKFVEQDMKLSWIENPETRHRTRHSIDHNGVFTMAYAESDVFADDATLKVSIQTCRSKPMEKSGDKAGKPAVAAAEPGRPSMLAALTAQSDLEERKFEVVFDAEQRREKVSVLTRKINTIQKRKELGVADKRDEWKLNRLLDRRAHVDSVWLFTNHIVVKSGAELQYLPRQVNGLLRAKPKPFNVDFGAEVWIQDIFPTGIDDLIQIFLINDITRRLFVITWNLQLNREHSNFQTTFDDSTNPEYLLLRTWGSNTAQKFNMMLDHGALINLQSNLPVQFFDIENERDWCPSGELKKNVQGQRKVQQDGRKYLELTHPGRIQHFISYTDWTYWVRYEQSRDQHELQRGRITQISPIARFPDGISVFHTFATNVKVLDAINNFISQQKHLAANQEDARIHMLPLMFLHSDPGRNKGGGKTTPLHLALDKQSPMAFEIMLSLLKDHTKVCVTSQLLDRLEDIIAQNSPVVNEFFDQSFFITDQFSGAQALDWTIGDDKDEHYVNVPSSFLTRETLQKLVQGPAGVKAEGEEDDPDSLRDNNFLALLGSGEVGSGEEGPSKYSLEVEDVATDKEDTSNLRQVEAKLLEFNWIFIGQNAAKFIAVLAETENDEIFATQQVRVLIEFLWQGYYAAIRDKLFIPFVFYMAAYSCYVTYLSKEHSNEFNALYCCEMACLVLAGKLGLRFLLLEAIQISRDRWAYFTDFWNLLDLCSLALNATYVFFELSNRFSENTINLIGAASIAIMWTKMFYWMRIGKRFAAFIRVVEQIVKSISVFSFMLAVVLVAFANCIMVLQLNRHSHEHEAGEVPPPIFDPFTGLVPFDAIIHAYLTGLGDFNKDNYSELNGTTVWVFFLSATILVQLVFMNLLIALMGDAYGEIMAIQEQSTMKELCAMMEDHIWMLDIGEIF